MNNGTWFGCKAVLVVLFLTTGNAGYAATERSNGTIKTFFEEWRLPGDEHAGMAELGVSHRFTQNFSAGFGSWMAVTGKRGG
ncbi:MAG: hypothetical protein WCI64_12740, partial [Chlorobium sp.]